MNEIGVNMFEILFDGDYVGSFNSKDEALSYIKSEDKSFQEEGLNLTIECFSIYECILNGEDIKELVKNNS